MNMDGTQQADSDKKNASDIDVAKPKTRQRKRIVAIFVLGALVLASCVGAGVYIFYRNKTTPITPSTEDTSEYAFGSMPEKPATRPIDEVQTNVGRLLDQGKLDEANQEIDKALTTIQDSPGRAILYTLKSSIYTSKDKAKALEYAQEAEKLDPSSTTAKNVAEKADFAGDKELAITYYQKQLDRLTDAQKQLYQSYIEARIQVLRG